MIATKVTIDDLNFKIIKSSCVFNLQEKKIAMTKSPKKIYQKPSIENLKMKNVIFKLPGGIDGLGQVGHS